MPFNMLLFLYFSEENSANIEGSYLGLFFYLFLSCFFSVILNSSFFISNEKNSSLFTAMLSNCKDIAITLYLIFGFKEQNLLFVLLEDYLFQHLVLY